METLVIFSAKYLYLLIIILAIGILLISSKETRRSFFKLALLSLPISLILGKICSRFYYDPRPFVVENIKPLIAHAADNGFPSDHTLLTITIAAIIFAYNRKAGVVLFVLGLLVGIARITAKIHHPIDILGSIFIASISVFISWYCLKKFHTYGY